MIVLLDNRDSFTFNLVDRFTTLGMAVRVLDAAETTWGEVAALEPDALVIGPGPGTPGRAGCSEDVIRHLAPNLPTLGVCLGHQAMATALGGRLTRARRLVHGQLEAVEHDGRGLWRELSSPLELVSYHSLVVDEPSLPSDLEITARGPTGEIAGLRHRTWPLHGLQHHPEAALCVERGGEELLENFLRLARLPIG